MPSGVKHTGTMCTLSFRHEHHMPCTTSSLVNRACRCLDFDSHATKALLICSSWLDFGVSNGLHEARRELGLVSGHVDGVQIGQFFARPRAVHRQEGRIRPIGRWELEV